MSEDSKYGCLLVMGIAAPIVLAAAFLIAALHYAGIL